MKFQTIAILLLTTLSTAQAATTYTIPFQNVVLNPNATIQGRYSFGNNPIIFCYENTMQYIGIFSWRYQGQTRTSTLSTPIVVNNTIFQGELADASGTVTITNNQRSTLIVSCDFGF